MRNRAAAVVSSAILAGVVLAAGTARADQCTAGAYTVSTPGPVVGTNATSITYTITGNNSPDHVATVVASGSTNCLTPSVVSVAGTPGSGNQSYGPGVGDPVTGLGKLACHEEAAKINPNGSVVQFTVTVSGVRSAAPKSVAVKKGSTIRSCEIVGIGDPAPPEVVAPVTEIIKEPGSVCAVEFTKDQITGKLLKAAVTGDSDPGCTLHEIPVDQLKLEVDTPIGQCADPPCALGAARFGEGYVHSGESSCTTRIIGGRVYTWGNPCP
jgi:hypothetical protein